MLCWKNTAEGAHALTAATPLLAKADHVIVCGVEEDDQSSLNREGCGAAPKLAGYYGHRPVQDASGPQRRRDARQRRKSGRAPISSSWAPTAAAG